MTWESQDGMGADNREIVGSRACNSLSDNSDPKARPRYLIQQRGRKDSLEQRPTWDDLSNAGKYLCHISRHNKVGMTNTYQSDVEEIGRFWPFESNTDCATTSTHKLLIL